MIIGVVEDRRDKALLLKEVKRLLPKGKKFAKKRDAVIRMIGKMSMMGISLSPDNTKLGAIRNFSLPAGHNFRDATCPGATEDCETVCYALKGFIQFQEYAYYINWAYLRLWPERFFRAFKNAQLSAVVRIHVGGDFFDVPYLKLWMDIVRARPDVRFFAYTRSWQNGRGKVVRKFIKPLRQFSELPNARLILSLDHDTGIPPADLIPASVRAWMAVDDNDMPPEPVELIFRHKRPSTMSAFPQDATGQGDGSTICPYERLKRSKQGAVLKEGAITCQNCAWCWGGAHEAYGKREDDLSAFSMWAGVDVPNRVAGMFRQFVPWKKTTEHGAAYQMGDGSREDCVCGAFALCSRCEHCLGCRCACE